jgi:hypothetical protein
MGNFFQSVASNKPSVVNRFLDEQTDIAAVYSLRKLRGQYSGDCLTIRRDSDDEEINIGFNGDDVVDTNAIYNFCGSGVSAYVKVWFDQSANGLDLSQTDTTKQPLIFNGTSVTSNEGKPAVGESGAVSAPVLLNSNFTPSIQSGYSYFSICGPTGYNAPVMIFSNVLMHADGTGQATHNHRRYVNPQQAINVVSTGYPSFGQRIAGNSVIQSAHYDGSSSGSTFVSRNDGYNVTGSRTDLSSPVSSSLIQIYHKAAMSELMVFNGDKSSTRKTIESNISDFYGFARLNYDLPLDTYTNVAVAYSVRKLRSAYTGYCMEVYNGTTYADIGFNEFNELDIAAIASHCGSNDGLVSKWYSQGSSSNTAFQTDTTKMPKIYDGTTSTVFMENGKPIIQNISGSYPRFQITNPVTGAPSAHNFIVARQDGSVNSIMSYGSYANENQGLYMSFNSGGGSRAGSDLYVDGVSQTNYSGKNQLWAILSPSSSANIINSKQDYNSTSSTLKHFIGLNQDKFPMFSTQEIIIFDSSMDNEREAIEQNQNSYFSVY